MLQLKKNSLNISNINGRHCERFLEFDGGEKVV